MKRLFEEPANPPFTSVEYVSDVNRRRFTAFFDVRRFSAVGKRRCIEGCASNGLKPTVSAEKLLYLIAMDCPLRGNPLGTFADPRVHILMNGCDGRVLARGGAQALFETIITAMLSFVVFTLDRCSSRFKSWRAIHFAIIATTLLRDGTVRYVVGLFIFTLFFAVNALDRMGQDVHQLIVFVSACLGIACFAAFLFLIDYAARLLRPVSILSRVGDVGMSVIDSVYPGDTIEAPPSEAENQLLGAGVHHHDEKPSGVVLAVMSPRLLRRQRT